MVAGAEGECATLGEGARGDGAVAEGVIEAGYPVCEDGIAAAGDGAPGWLPIEVRNEVDAEDTWDSTGGMQS